MTWLVLQEVYEYAVVGVFSAIGFASLLNFITLLYVIFNVVIRKTEGTSPSKRVKENSVLFIQVPAHFSKN